MSHLIAFHPPPQIPAPPATHGAMAILTYVQITFQLLAKLQVQKCRTHHPSRTKTIWREKCVVFVCAILSLAVYTLLLLNILHYRVQQIIPDKY